MRELDRVVGWPRLALSQLVRDLLSIGHPHVPCHIRRSHHDTNLPIAICDSLHAALQQAGVPLSHWALGKLAHGELVLTIGEPNVWRGTLTELDIELGLA